MENASKALLIAGAILIAILLIAIGMMVFKSANGVINTATSNMSDQEKTIHNSKFDMYAGNKSGSTVQALLSAVRTNNASKENVQVQINGSNIADNYNVKNAKTYTITMVPDNNGVITNIEIKEDGGNNITNAT